MHNKSPFDFSRADTVGSLRACANSTPRGHSGCLCALSMLPDHNEHALDLMWMLRSGHLPLSLTTGWWQQYGGNCVVVVAVVVVVVVVEVVVVVVVVVALVAVVVVAAVT